MNLRLNGATVTRVREELDRLLPKMGLSVSRNHPVWSRRDGYGPEHRGIEEFVEAMLEVLPVEVLRRACGVAE